MENKTNISKQIEDTLHVLDSIQEPTVSPFFKQKVLRTMFQEKEEKKVVVNWFTPKLQLAAIALILLVNAVSIAYVFNNATSNNIDTFAEEYSLSSTNSLLN